MKKRRSIFIIVTAAILCGCNQNPQTVARTTPTLIPALTATAEILPTLTPTAEPTLAPEPTPTAAPTPTAPPTPITRPTLIPELIPTITSTLTLTPEPPSTSIPTPTPEPTPTEAPTPADPFTGEFWCNVYEKDTDLRMTLSEISVLNEQNFRAEGTALVKLSGLEQLNATRVREMIESYSFPKKKYYGNEVLSEKTKAEILSLRNFDTLKRSDDVDLKYGILIQNADLRSFPAEKPLTAEQNGRYDYLQETVLYLNEAVVVLHTSTDGAWCFVQGENYFGWIRENLIAYCEKEEMQTHYEALLDPENKNSLIVTKNIEYTPEDGVVYPLRMGTKLFFETNENEAEYVMIPVRDDDKKLQIKEYPISLKEKNNTIFHRGYLPYTTGNVIALATELLGTPYAWGDSLPYGNHYSYDTEIGMDCSSTVAAVYRCFGFVLPRNTGAQRSSAWNGETVSAYNIQQRKELLNQLPAGVLLYSPGHVMLYLGKHEGEYYILHNTTTEVLSDGTEKGYYRCVISPMSLGKKGKTILEQLLEVKIPVI